MVLAGRQLALAVLPLSITDTGGVSRLEKRTERPSPRTREIPKRPSRGSQFGWYANAGGRGRGVRVCARVFARAADLVDGEDETENESDDDTARNDVRETSENRGRIRTGVPCKAERRVARCSRREFATGRKLTPVEQRRTRRRRGA